MNLTHEWKDNCSFFTDNETFIFSVDDPDNKFNEKSILTTRSYYVRMCRYLLTKEQFSAHAKMEYEEGKSTLCKLKQQLDKIKFRADEVDIPSTNELFLRACANYEILCYYVDDRFDQVKSILMNYGSTFLNINQLINIKKLDDIFFNYFSYVKHDINKMDYDICLSRAHKSHISQCVNYTDCMYCVNCKCDKGVLYDNKRSRINENNNDNDNDNTTKKIKL